MTKLLLVVLVVLATSRTIEVNGVPIDKLRENIVTRNLKEDLDDFIKLVPQDEIQELFFGYLYEDEDFGEALDYVTSDEFHSLLEEILSMPEVEELIKFLKESNLDVDGFFQKVKELLGYGRFYHSLSVKSGRISGGLPGFIKDVKDLLPIDEIEKLVKEKLQTSADFKQLFDRIKSEEFQGLIDKLAVNPKIEELLARAEAKGVDVQAILDFLTTVFGHKFPSRPSFRSTMDLKSDLQEFINLIPQEKIEELFLDYLSEDEDFGEALDYVTSDEFHSLLEEILSMPEVEELIKFLKESNLDVDGFFQKIKELLGYGRFYHSLSVKSGRISGGLPGFIKDVKDLLPIDEIEKLVKEKLQTSADFKQLFDRIKSEEFQGLIDKLAVNPKIEELLARAEAKGVDVQAILDFLTTVFGHKFPSRPSFRSTMDLKSDLQEFINLIPQEKIEELFLDYLSEDEDFGEALDYITSEEFLSLMQEILSMPEVEELIKFLKESNLDVDGFFQKIKELLGYGRFYHSLSVKSGRISGGLPGFIKDVKDLLPIDEIEKLVKEKLQTSADFKQLFDRIKSEEFQGLIDKLAVNPKIEELLARAEAKGVDVQAILDFLTTVFGHKFPSRPSFRSTMDLKSDLQEFINLIPQEKIEELFLDYLSEDEDFGEALDYVTSDEFHSLLKEILSMPEVEELIKFLKESNLDVDGFFQKIKELLGYGRFYHSLSVKSGRISGGLPGFIKDVKDLLPIDEIEKLVKEKLQTSADFKQLFDRIKSEEFQGLIDKLAVNPKIEELLARAEAKGVDVQAILDFLTTVFGHKFPSRPSFRSTMDLKSDLQEFINLIPQEKIEELFLDYLSEDEDFGEALDYITSEEFLSLMQEILSMAEVEELIKFLKESNLDVDGFFQKIKELLGYGRFYHSLSVKSGRISGGLPGFVKDVKDLLPIDEIEKLVKEKLQTSADFKQLFDRIKSEEFQGLIDKLAVNPKIEELLARAEAKGVDVQAILDFLTTVFGHKFPSRPSFRSTMDLKSDLQEFINLIPQEKIEELFLDYLSEDEDFGEALDYVTSDEFHSLLKEILSMPEVEELIKFLKESNLDVDGFFQKIKELLGYGRFYHSLSVKSGRISGGLPGFIKDVKDLLPIDEIEKLVKEKLQTSADFKQLFDRIKSEEFQGLIDKLAVNPKIEELLARAEAKGVDVQAILDFLTTVFGHKFPSRPSFRSTMDLKSDLQEFINLIPQEKIEELFLDYLSEDEDFGEALDYVTSDEFHSLLKEILSMPEVEELIKFLKESNLDVDGFFQKIKELLGYGRFYHSLSVKSGRISGGLPGFIKDVKDLLPIDEIEKLVKEKLQTSADFKQLFDRIKSEEFQGLIDKLAVNPKIEELLARAEAKGVDVQAILDFLTTVFGHKFPSRPSFRSTMDLKSDLQEFINLIPQEKIEELFLDYLSEDEDFGEALDYVTSDEFHSLLKEILSMPEVEELIKFLKESNLDVDGFFQKVKELLGYGRFYHSLSVKSGRISGGLPGFIKDVKDLLPIDEIEKLVKEKLQTSADFKQLFDRIKSEEFQGLIDKLAVNPKIEELLARAEAKGVDVQAILDFLTTVFGHKFPSRPSFRSTMDLKSDLQEFINLIPQEKIEELFLDYLSEDEDFGEALDYVTSDEFHSLLKEILSMPEVEELIKFLKESNLDVDGFFQKIKELLGYGRFYHSLSVKSGRISGGLPGFIKDVKDLLPIDEIEKLVKEKLQTSADFKQLFDRIKSEEFQGLIDKLAVNPKIEELLARAEAKGVDVQAILDFLTTVFGHKFPSRPSFRSTMDLKSDLQEFINLIPQEKIEELFLDYLSEDEDFGEALDYVTSDEFHSLLKEILSMPEVEELIKFLKESNLDVDGFFQKIKELLGYGRFYHSLSVKSGRISGGLPGFIKDVKDLLPIDEIEKLVKEKLQTSADFKQLFDRIKSEEFQGLIDKLAVNPKIQELLARAEAKGVDVQAILDFLTTVFGHKFPSRPSFRSTMDLKSDLQEFINLIPQEKIEELFLDYLSEDEDFGEALDYITSEEFLSLMQEILSMAEVEELIKFLKESNLDVDGFFQKIKELLGYGRFYHSLSVKSGRISGGLPGFIKDVKDLLPIDEIEKLVKEKLQTSADFKQLFDRIKSEEFQGLIDKLAVNPKIEELLARAEAKGVDVQAILDFFTTVFGHKFPSRPLFRSTMDLKNDFEDFSKLIPVDQIENLLLEYISEDEDFGDVLDYIISDEFNSLTADIGNIPEVKEIIDLLQSSGLDVVSLIQRIKDFLGFNSISLHLYSRTTRITGGLSGFLKDVEALLPIAELEKLYYKKLETSEDFKKIINQLKSQKFQSLVDQVMNNPKFQELIKQAEAKGVDVETILDFLSHIFGLKFPIRVVVFSPRSLIDDLNEFVKLLPIDKIEELFFEYLSEDKDFGEALDYVTSDDFHSLINEILSMSEAKDLIEFLKISGLDVDGFFNKVKDMLGWDSRLFLLLPLRSSRISGGLPGFIKDVEALLPIDEIEEYYYKKLESSQDFANLINRLKSEKFKVLVDRVIANPKFQDLMTKAQARGVDVQAIIDFFSTLFGHQFSLTPVLLKVVEKEEEVIDILREIWSIVPTDTLLDLALDYVIEDKDCQELFQYVFSEDFHKILVEVENIPEIRSLLEFLNGAGLNIYEWLDEFHDVIGIKLNLFLSSKITGGLPGLIEDIRAALPLDDLVDIYSKKLEESKKFQEFVNRLNTHELQNAVNALEKNDGFETWLTKLEAKGVDLNAVVEIITAITGIKFPPRPLQIIRSYGLY